MPPQTPQQPQAPVPQPQPQAIPVPQAPAYAAPAPTKKRFPTWLKIVGAVIIVFVVIIIIAAVTATTATKAPQKISDQLVTDVQTGNTSAAYALTSKTFQQATTEDQLDSLIKQVEPSLQGQATVTGRAIQKTSGAPETAVLVYTVKTSSGNMYIKVELQKSGNAWQVINFQPDNKPLDTTVE